MPKRKSHKAKSREASTRPYTQMMLCGLDAGLSIADMREMKYTHLMQILYEWEDMQGADVDEYIDATGADVRALTRI